MKLQNLIIIFIIIIIPIILVFSYYLGLEAETIRMQTDYDEKLIEATKEAVEAFEINTVEWNSEFSTLANSKRRDLLASINTFTTSLSNKLGIGGTSKENILNYVPAIVYIMYDGYYIYAPTYVPQTITDDKGVQVFYYKDAASKGEQEYTITATQDIAGETIAGEPMYVYDKGGAATGTYKGTTFTTNVNYAKKTYKHVLKTFVPYTTTYGDYTINYTLDNYIRVYGKNETREGYILNETITAPVNSITGIKADGVEIMPEILSENIPIRNNKEEDIEVKPYTYIYNSNNDKRYYENAEDAGENIGRFFTVDSDYVKVYLPKVDVNSSLAEYKKVLIRTKTTNPEYLEIYQLLNKDEGNIWYYKDTTGNYIPYDSFNSTVNRNQDCSAINYYVENSFFVFWLEDERFDLNDIIAKKNETIINNINENLKLSIANYSANSTINYKLPKLSDADWEQALSNISMITFFQGMKIGLKTYNNYSIVTSTENNEYVGEDSLYYIGQGDIYYHRYGCEYWQVHTAYLNTEFKVQSYILTKEDGVDETKYYYKHADELGEEAILECFYCIVNRNKIGEADDYRAFLETRCHALARERYIQMSRTRLTSPLSIEPEEPVEQIVVTFNAGLGNLDTTSKTVTKNSQYGALPTPTRDGYIFRGWYTATTGGTLVTSNTVVDKDYDHTLYARWRIAIPTDPIIPTEPGAFSASISNTGTINEAGVTRYTAQIRITGGTAPYTIITKINGIQSGSQKIWGTTYDISTTSTELIIYTIVDSEGNSTEIEFKGGNSIS